MTQHGHTSHRKSMELARQRMSVSGASIPGSFAGSFKRGSAGGKAPKLHLGINQEQHPWLLYFTDPEIEAEYQLSYAYRMHRGFLGSATSRGVSFGT